MGGHGGLNILPQKRWNVYNYDNREKVRRDEENAAREEQIKRDETRRREADHRLQQLRKSRGLPNQKIEDGDAKSQQQKELREQQSALGSRPTESESRRHINLFEGIRIFDPVTDEEMKKKNKRKSESNDGEKVKKMKKKESEVRVVGPEDEKYRMGYGVCGKGVKLPWYMEKKKIERDSDDSDDNSKSKSNEKGKSSNGKKSLEELREERLRRERAEKERERALVSSMMNTKNRDARR